MVQCRIGTTAGIRVDEERHRKPPMDHEDTAMDTDSNIYCGVGGYDDSCVRVDTGPENASRLRTLEGPNLRDARPKRRFTG